MADLPKTADVIIIGGGVHGASAAYHFARKKAGRILLIEKKFIASGPTGRSTALVRQAFTGKYDVEREIGGMGLEPGTTRQGTKGRSPPVCTAR